MSHSLQKNEELTLPRMIESLSDFKKRGGEILLLDTGSTDDTVKVATKLGCKVISVDDKFKIEIDEDLAKKINDKFVRKRNSINAFLFIFCISTLILIILQKIISQLSRF